MRTSLLTFACFLAYSTGCSGGHGPDGASDGNVAAVATVTEAVSSLPQDDAPDVSPSDQAALVSGNSTFAFDVYGALRASQPASSNLFFSPYSMSSAFAMAYAGAAGSTATEMAKAMSFTLPATQLAPAFDWLDLQLASRSSEAQPAGEPTPFALHVANSLWGDDHLAFQPAFLDTLATDYGAGVEQVDFSGNPNGAEQAINLWVSDQTGGKIPQVLPMGAIDDTTVFVLVDAMYFQAGWQSPFAAIETTSRPFTRGDGTSEQTLTMQQTSTFAYAQASGWQLVELPYVGGQEAMDIVLPATGTDAAFDAGLTSAGFASMIGAMQPQLVQLTLPKFQVAGPAFSVKTMLQGLGMDAAWTGAADFAPMTATPVALGNAFHQSFVSVDENGTQAAAATAIVGVDAGVASGAPPQVVTMAVDRPFFLAIRDVSTGTVLFAGKIEDPAQSQ